MNSSDAEDTPESSEANGNTSLPRSRLQLLLDVFVFQGKLAVDGARDLVLVPVSIVSALFGLVFGGTQPDRYYQRVLEFGRRTEHWINLFGHQVGAGTSDDLIKPFQERVFEEAEGRPWLKNTGEVLNRKMDSVVASAQKRRPPPVDEDK